MYIVHLANKYITKVGRTLANSCVSRNIAVYKTRLHDEQCVNMFTQCITL